MTKGLATSLCYSVVKATAVVAAIGSSTARTDDGVIEEMACFVSFQATEFTTNSQNVTMCLFIVIVAGCERKRHVSSKDVFMVRRETNRRYGNLGLT